MRRRGFKTDKLAHRAEDAARQQYGGTDLAADGSVAAELTQWLRERELDLAPTTLSNYRNAVQKYILPSLGGRQLYTLDKRAIHDLYRHLISRGGRNGRPLSAETVRHVHRTLMKALKDLGVVIDGVRQPRPADRGDKGRKGVGTAAQCRAFLVAASNDRLNVAWLLAVVCGMRRGELAGLKWSKVDLTAQRRPRALAASRSQWRGRGWGNRESTKGQEPPLHRRWTVPCCTASRAPSTPARGGGERGRRIPPPVRLLQGGWHAILSKEVAAASVGIMTVNGFCAEAALTAARRLPMSYGAVRTFDAVEPQVIHIVDLSHEFTRGCAATFGDDRRGGNTSSRRVARRP